MTRATPPNRAGARPGSVLAQLAHHQGRPDERPNEGLARTLVEQHDRRGIAEVARHLDDPDRAIQADCIKVLYEVGYLAPRLIAPFTPLFLRLLERRNNRLVWGAMIALSTVAELRAGEIFAKRDPLTAALNQGSVISRDNAVQTLAVVAASSPARARALLPLLFDHLASGRPKDVAQHSEKILPAVSPLFSQRFEAVLRSRLPELSAPQQARVNRVLRRLVSA